MARHQYEVLWESIQFSRQAEYHDCVATTNSQWRCQLADNCVNNYNTDRELSFSPSKVICIDESFTCWYGQGKNGINTRLPMYVAIDHKPENGCEIQDSCDGVAQIMLRLRLVKDEADERRYLDALAVGGEQGHGENVGHGTKVALDVVKPWLDWQGPPRIVCGDSYFASVATCKEFATCNIGFIGIVKTATKEYPMDYLKQAEVERRGGMHALVSKDGDGVAELVSLMWVDRERRFFIGNMEGTEQTEPIYRKRWRQIDETMEEDAELVHLEIPQPMMVKTYYNVCGKIDQHNRKRQTDVELEKYLCTNDWSKRINLSLLSMIIVDTLNFDQACKGQECDASAHDWIMGLTEEMIDNDFDRPSSSPIPILKSTHLKDKNGHSLQRQCRVCKIKCTKSYW
ncbi:hypothetical protein ACHAXS_003342 [Conticribra weissflogii]